MSQTESENNGNTDSNKPISASERMKKAWETRRARATGGGTRRGRRPSGRVNITPEAASERMRKAWATRRARAAGASGSGSGLSATGRGDTAKHTIKVTVSGDQGLIQQYVRYVGLARQMNDLGILESPTFKKIDEILKNRLKI